MAKKTKRKVSQGSRPAVPPTVAPVVPAETSPAPAAAPAARTSFSRRTQTAAEFNPDYTYVIKDLKRIGILAGVFFFVLVALSFIIK